MSLRIHHFLPFSFANGPGCRATIWLQGCPLHCPGCFNVGTHAFDQGEWLAVDKLVDRIKTLGQCIEGVTVSGGEPLIQAAALGELLRRLRSETMLSVIVFTGYTWEETHNLLARSGERSNAKPANRAQQQTNNTAFAVPDAEPSRPLSLLQHVDVLIAGRYNQRLRVASGLRGSANKTIHFLTNRYSLRDIESVPPAEIIISSDGGISISGIAGVNVEAAQHPNSAGGKYG